MKDSLVFRIKPGLTFFILQKLIDSMELSFFVVPFGFLSEAEVSSILSISPQFSSEMFYSSDSMLKNKIEENKVLLQIRGHYLVQMNSSCTSIISGFRFDYQIKFEISRSVSLDPIKKQKMKKNDLLFERISFIFTEGEKKTLDFFSLSTRTINNFISVLERKNIVQLGFHNKKFQPTHQLGNGVTAKVIQAIRLRDNKKVAIKSFRKENYFKSQDGKGKEALKKEIRIHSELNHKHICKYLGVYESQNSIYVILEPLACSLLQYLRKYGAQEEAKARKMFYQLLKGVGYLHRKGIMHRDIKPQNIMLRKDTYNSHQHSQISIVDFGLAQYTTSSQFIYKRCGTPGYIAPEVIALNLAQNELYNQSCDVFSLGVIFYNLQILPYDRLFNRPLFIGQNMREILKKNKECEINFTELAQKCSQSAKNLLSKMLEKDPHDRITVEAALEDDYFIDISKDELSLEETKIQQQFN